MLSYHLGDFKRSTVQFIFLRTGIYLYIFTKLIEVKIKLFESDKKNHRPNLSLDTCFYISLSVGNFVFLNVNGERTL